MGLHARLLGGGPAVDSDVHASSVRVATFNTSLFRPEAGQLIVDLATAVDRQAQTIAEIIQRVRPDVLLLNEFDFDEAGWAAELFQGLYLSVGQNGAEPIRYPHFFCAPSNTGVQSGFDLDKDGELGGPGDAFGYGVFPGQYGMIVFSQYPIDMPRARTFQRFLWRDMPGALLPSRYTAEEIEVLRLSSKSHWDVPIVIGEKTVHFLASHPTPPGGDGARDDLRRRNFDEIRFWAEYIDPAKNSYFTDDQGRRGGLPAGARFVIAGDQNADPHDGGSLPGAARQLTDHPLINNSVIPRSAGGVEQAALQGLANMLHKGDPAHDTADFYDGSADEFETAPGNLRVDYVLPSKNLTILDCGVFWPETTGPLFVLVGVNPFPASDHRLVWVDVQFRAKQHCPKSYYTP